MPDHTTTSTPAATTSGQRGLNLPAKIAIAVPAILLLGNYMPDFLGDNAKSVVAVIMLLVLGGIIYDHFRPNATGDDLMMALAFRILKWASILALIFLTTPGLLNKTKEFFYGTLPENTEQEARRRAEQLDLRTAHGIRSDNNEGLQTLLTERQVLAEQADADLAWRTKMINTKLGTMQCWGWNGKKSIPNQYCNNERLAAELDASRAQYDRDIAVAERQRPSGTPTSTPSLPFGWWDTTKSYVASAWNLVRPVADNPFYMVPIVLAGLWWMRPRRSSSGH